jgi:hypothetical protein
MSHLHTLGIQFFIMNGHYIRTCGHVFHFGCMIPWLYIVEGGEVDENGQEVDKRKFNLFF